MALNSKKSDELVDSNNLVLEGVLTLLKNNNEHKWTGTMTELGDSLYLVLDKRKTLALPKSPSYLRVTMNKLVNRLRARGIVIKFGRTPDSHRTRFVTLRQN